MNKLFLIVLAVCLVSAHGFVKRDAPAAAKEDNIVNTIQEKIADFTKQFTESAKTAFNPDTVKQNLDNFVNSMKKAIDDIQPKTEKQA